MIMPIAEIILQAQSSQVLEAINHVHQLARAGQLRTAMEEAFQALTYAPTYLPLHSLIGDLLVRENHTPEAIAKFTAVATAYSVRGEAAQATKILKRVIIRFGCLRLDERFIHLTDFICTFGRDNFSICEFQCFKVLNSGGL